ncbi:hypothetical protein HPB49_026115 [Dermacentor silvarum]|nr:hypothetical protein HPB49_026115 [Dermacentor silvarum]
MKHMKFFDEMHKMNEQREARKEERERKREEARAQRHQEILQAHADYMDALRKIDKETVLLQVQLEVRQQNRNVLHELQQLRHEVRVVSERLDETEPLDKTRAVSLPALSTVPPVLPRLPADNIEELEAAVRDEAVAATFVLPFYF